MSRDDDLRGDRADEGCESHPSAEEVGSVAEEAARLLGVVSEVFAAGATGTGGPDDADDADDADGTGETSSPSGAGRADAGRHGDACDACGADGIGDGLAALVRRAAGVWRDLDEHVATGAEECRWCPMCRGIHLVRETSPEVRSHLVGAARSLLAAGAALVDQLDDEEPLREGEPPQPRSPEQPHPRSAASGTTHRRRAGVEHIDLDDVDAGPDREEQTR